MDYKEIIDKTYEVVDTIKETKEFKELMALKEQIETTLSPLITKFKQAQETYVEALKYGSYHPDLKKYQQELSKYKAELFTNELVEKYKGLEAVIQKNLNNIVNEVTTSISHRIIPKRII